MPGGCFCKAYEFFADAQDEMVTVKPKAELLRAVWEHVNLGLYKKLKMT